MGYTGKKALVIKLAYIEPSTRWRPSCSASGKGPCRPARRPRPVATGAAQGTGRRQGRACCRRSTSARATAKCGACFARHFEIAKYTQLPPERMSEAVEYLIELELKIADPALPDMRSLPRFASYDRYAASIEAAYTILSRLNMHDVQFSQARLGTHPLRGADYSRFYNAVMREVQISAAMVDAARQRAPTTPLNFAKSRKRCGSHDPAHRLEIWMCGYVLGIVTMLIREMGM